jgi:signal peptidase II
LLDYLSKSLAVANLADHPINILGSFLKLELVYNTGAAFSLATSKTILLSGFAIIVAALIFYFATKIERTIWAVFLGLVLGGIFGNLADRIFRAPGALQGAVVDWIKIPHWPTFNIADSAIVIGVLGVAYLRLTKQEINMSDKTGKIK